MAGVALKESGLSGEVGIVSPSRFVRRAVISFFIGVAITFLTTFGVPLEWRIRVLAYGGIGGFLINAWCHLLARALGGWLARHAWRGRVVYAGVYFLGGVLGPGAGCERRADRRRARVGGTRGVVRLLARAP